MLRFFNDRYEVTAIKKVRRGTLKALVTFRSIRSGRLYGPRELHADDILMWVEVPAHEGPTDPNTIHAYMRKSTVERLRLGYNWSIKQRAFRLALCRHLGLSDDAAWPLDDEMRSFFRSRRWDKWTPPEATTTVSVRPAKAAKQ